MEMKKMPARKLTPKMTSLLASIRKMAAVAPSLDELERDVVEAMSEQIPYYNWTGFYMLDPEEPETLVLGSFVGELTFHVCIPISEGICGAAITEGETICVDDVNTDSRYLSCSIRTKSEIVVPIRARGEIVGEIDIDSHAPAAFTEQDREFLEEAARIVGGYIERHGIGTD
jgi:L-methionine (R)-S-oxide reductase